MPRASAFAALIVLAPLPAGAADAEPADPAPFEGRWSIGFPKREDAPARKPVLTCDEPAEIALVGENLIRVTRPDAKKAREWEVMDFGGRNPWWPVDGAGDTWVTEWRGEDSFLLADTKKPDSFSSDWKKAKLWTRCPE